MEKAVLKTLVYADLFDFPLKAWEVHKWLIGREAKLRQVEKALKNLKEKSKIKHQGGFYFLEDRKGLVKKRIKREEVSKKFLTTANWIALILKVIPWIKLIGISGGLSMGNASNNDDIDFFIVSERRRIWLSRILTALVLWLFGKRRGRGVDIDEASGMVCVNLMVDEDNLGQKKHDLFTAHEVLQLKVLWQRDGMYNKFLEGNSWVFKFLPNWKGEARGGGLALSINGIKKQTIRNNKFLDYLEKGMEWVQLKYMGMPSGKERVMQGALYFHPDDKRDWVLKGFTLRMRNFQPNGRGRSK